MSSKVTPCVTIMICVAGCSSTTSQDLPHTRNFPAPKFDISTAPPPPLSVQQLDERVPQLNTIREAIDADRPTTVDVPVAVFERKPPSLPQLATRFENVPEGFLKDLPDGRVEPAKPFFTPLKKTEPNPSAPPLQTAEAILEPLLKPISPEAVVMPEPIAYAEYVAVGPEYFGLDSAIAPYVISHSPDEPLPQDSYIATTPVAILPKTFVAEANTATVISEPNSPMPRSRPSEQPPDPAPSQNVEVAGILAPRPTPDPRRAPTEQAPRLPFRITTERLPALQPREDTLEDIDQKRQSLTKSEPPKPSGWSSAVQKELATPRTPEDRPPELPLYKVIVSPAENLDTELASLSPEISLADIAPPDLSLVTSDDLAAGSAYAPPPRKKPTRTPEGLQVAGTASGVQTRSLKSIETRAANDSTAASCLVNKGSNDRMILVCEGVDVSKAQVFRAVVEGESAFRGLRAFDSTQDVLTIYGFNAERFNAMSQGPRSARDLAFLRALRKSGREIRVKGRPFDLYLMKGDNRLATVLIEQASDVEMPASIRYN